MNPTNALSLNLDFICFLKNKIQKYDYMGRINNQDVQNKF